MVDREEIARFNRRIDMVKHLARIRVLHEAQKAGLSGSSLFVVVRQDWEPEDLGETAQFIKENSNG